MYRPLPDCLSIKESDINGLGLFSKEAVKVNTVFGISHHLINTKLIRTPLGGFYNHSDKPNCEKAFIDNGIYGAFYILKTIREIMPDEEITVEYTFDEYKEGFNVRKQRNNGATTD